MAALQSSVRFALMLLVVVAPCRQVVATFNNITAADCLVAFAVLNLDLNDFDRYPEYFHEGSVVQLAQAGMYTGPAAIEEYLKFANVQNPAIDERTNVNQTFALSKVDTENGICEFLLDLHSHFVFNELFSNATSEQASQYRLFLNVTSGKLERANVLLEDEYLHWVAEMIALPNIQSWVCSAMENSCNDTWSLNGLVDQPDCMARLAALPSSTGETAEFDGNSQACRFLHGVLAKFNEDHCPHISFLPLEDKKGELRCQRSSDVAATELFTDEQRAFFELFKAENGLPPRGFIARVQCGSSNHQACPNRYTCDAAQGICVANDHEAPSTSTSNGKDGNNNSSSTTFRNAGTGSSAVSSSSTTTTSHMMAMSTTHLESDGCFGAALGAATRIILLMLAALSTAFASRL